MNMCSVDNHTRYVIDISFSKNINDFFLFFVFLFLVYKQCSIFLVSNCLIYKYKYIYIYIYIFR